MKRLIFSLCLMSLPSVGLADPDRWRSEWPQTDFTQTIVPEWSQITSGGPPKDGIPALDAPEFVPVSAEDKLTDREPVITLEVAGQTPRAYPIRYLIWHEIANDWIGDLPVAVTFCPLCNSGLSFDRRVNGRVLSFGVSGKLRNSDMVMYDRETQSWWQQATGSGIVGQMTGRDLRSLPSWMESWAEFKARNPKGLVMTRPAGFQRAYGENPYVRYDSLDRPFLYQGEEPPHGIAPLARVVRVGQRAWPVARLRQGPVRQAGLILSWSSGQASALDTRVIGQGRDVGSIRVQDGGTGADVPHDVMFAFAFHAFWPQGQWMLN